MGKAIEGQDKPTVNEHGDAGGTACPYWPIPDVPLQRAPDAVVVKGATHADTF